MERTPCQATLLTLWQFWPSDAEKLLLVLIFAQPLALKWKMVARFLGLPIRSFMSDLMREIVCSYGMCEIEWEKREI